MTTPIDRILSYQAIDLAPFEIRGARYGANNATTTSPVFTGGVYNPTRNIQDGSGFFHSDSTYVDNFYIPCYSDTSGMRVGDMLVADSTVFTITGQRDSTSVWIDPQPSFSGVTPFDATLINREYLIEPDPKSNDFFGTATFTNGSDLVTGVGTTWGIPTDVSTGDFIKRDGYQQNFPIKTVLGPTSLQLTRGYNGDTTTGPYTARKSRLERLQTRYVRNEFTYDSKKSRWVYDATTASGVDTSATPDYGAITDGVTVSYVPALNLNNPDMMEKATVFFKTFAQSTQFDAFQFPLPTVPNPESSLSVLINNQLQDRYPDGNRDYIVSYSPNPIWEPPLPFDQRQVANLMFLKGAQGTLNSLTTEEGVLPFLGSDNQPISGIMPRSEMVYLDSTVQTWPTDYVVEYNSGIGSYADFTTNEPLVKYVAADRSLLVDMGFSVYLDGTRQKVSFPPQVDDVLLFQPKSGRYKPRTQDRPSAGQEYIFNYMVDGTSIRNKTLNLIPGQTTFRTEFWPVKRDSVMIQDGTNVLLADDDFHISYQTGMVTLFNPAGAGPFLISYIPTSQQINGMSYDGTTSICTAYQTNASVQSASSFTVSIYDTRVDLAASYSGVVSVYNATRDATYNISGVYVNGQMVTLEQDATNLAIGMGSHDDIQVSYKFTSDNLQFAPVTVNYFSLPGGTNQVIFEGVDATAQFPAGCILGLQQPDAQIKYLFFIDSVSYQDPDTAVTLRTQIPEQMVNPIITVSDSTVTFLPVPLSAEPVISGVAFLQFKGPNIHRIFRRDTVIKIGDYVYAVAGTSYDHANRITTVQLASKVVVDVTDPVSLASLEYSDQPLYASGETDLNPVDPIISVIPQPGLILNTDGTSQISFFVDSSALYVQGQVFPFDSSTTLSDISSGLSVIPNVQALVWEPLWPSRKLAPTDGVKYFWKDSSALLYVGRELRFNGTDYTSYTLTPINGILLDHGLVEGDRLNLDYMGQRFMGDTTTSFSLNYFTSLPQKSKVVASYEYDNLDQFYIQALSRRDFFNLVSAPRLKEEAKQLNGNVGQGGEVAGDENSGNSSGGLANDEYRRKDAEIECRVFKDIYDFFSNRVYAYGLEFWAAEGLKLFNNDGMFTNAQQLQATKVYNRIFAQTDYTGMPPLRCNPLTGEMRTNAALFTNGSLDVYGIGTNWSQQLTNGDFIGRGTSNKRYEINQVLSNTHIQLVDSFTEPSTTDTDNGELFAASTLYPFYDDDGHLGAKVNGNRSNNFGLSITGDEFNVYVDGVLKSYTFSYPLAPPLPDPMSIMLWYMFSPPQLTGPQIASTLTSAIGGIKISYEPILSPADPYGYKTALVIRSDSTVNSLIIGSGSANKKLGFTPGATSIGNLDRTGQNPESALLKLEHDHMMGTVAGYSLNEYQDMFAVIEAGFPDRLNRLNFLTQVNEAHSHIVKEANLTALELDRLQKEITATEIIMQEPSITPSYGDATLAHDNAVAMYNATVPANAYNWSIANDWEGKNGDWQWALDFDSTRQFIAGIGASSIGVDHTGAGITPIDGQYSFILEVPAGYDRRILNATIDSFDYSPRVYSATDNTEFNGTWSMMDVPYQYSATNQARFNLDESSALFYIIQDSLRPDPTCYTVPTSLGLFWVEDEGSVTKTFPFTTYPKLGDLTRAIDAVPGFGIYSTPNASWYDYTNLTITSGFARFNVQINAGSQSPVFEMVFKPKYHSDTAQLVLSDTTYNLGSYPTLGSIISALPPGYTLVNSIAPDFPSGPFQVIDGIVATGLPGTSIYMNAPSSVFNVKFDLGNPQYEVTGSGVNLYWTDNGAPQILSAFFPVTIGALASALTSPGFMPVLPGFLSANYTYGTIPVVAVSPVPGPGSPVTLMAGPNSPLMSIWTTDTIRALSIDSTALRIDCNAGTFEYLYASYPDINDIVYELTHIPNLHVNLLYDNQSYVYGTLQPQSGTISNIAPGTQINFGGMAPVLTLAFNASNPAFQTTLTNLVLSYTDGTSLRTISKAYSTYPLIQDMTNTISAEAGWDASLTYAAGLYSYSSLKVQGTTSVSGYTPVPLRNTAEALTVYTATPTFSSNVTGITITLPGPTNYPFSYATYPTVNSLSNAIGNTVPGVDASPVYNPAYAFGHLDTTSGSISASGTFIHFDSALPGPLFTVYFDMTNQSYRVDSSGLNIYWNERTDYTGVSLPYTDYTTVLSMKNAINQITGLDATGSPVYNSRRSRAFLDATGSINPDATVYRGLDPCYVVYATIDEKILSDRTDYLLVRDPLVISRYTYLDQTRDPQILRNFANEELLRSTDGGVGDLWTWANNRFNRRQGSEARLKQAEAILESNQSALEINKGLS